MLRARHTEGISLRQLAREYAVSHETVRQALRTDASYTAPL